MHEHDLDMIASLADGSLDDQTEARARVETCQQCRLEYETQVSILAALSTIQPVTMTELEKAALHRDLWTELSSQPTGKAATPWWYRMSYAAAGLFVVVGLVAVVSQLGSSGDSLETAEAFSEMSSGLYAGPTGEADAPLQPMDDGGSDSTNTTIAADDANVESTPDFKTLADETRLQQLPATVRAAPSEDQAACLTHAGLEDDELVGTIDNGRTYLIVIPAGGDLDTETPVTFVDAVSCEVVHVEE